MSALITHTCGTSHVWNLCNIVEGIKPSPNKELQHVQTLDYQDMLNIGKLGAKGVPFFMILLCHQTKSQI